MSKRYRLVLVKWRDSLGCGTEWTDLTDFEFRPATCLSAGWLVREDPEWLVVVPHLARDGRDGCGDMTIPRSAVVSVVDLEQKDEGATT